MRVSLVRPAELGGGEIAAWRRFAAADPDLASPYLDPGFAIVAAEVRPEARIAIAEDGGRPVGFLPLQLRGGVARPLCGGLSDVQAMIADPGWDWDAAAWLGASGLSMLEFTFQRAAQLPFRPYHRQVVPSHVIDLRGGYAAFEARRLARLGGQGPDGILQKLASRLRRLEKQVGPVRLVMHDTDPANLRRLLGWKSAQYRTNGIPDVFGMRWTVELMERLHATRTAEFAGKFSTLWAGEHMVAGHMGIRSASVLHWWFPSYDTAFSKHSPGRTLLQKLIRHAPEQGLTAIELGAGDEPYKLEIADEAIPVAAGFVGRPSLPLLARRLRHGTEDLARRLPIGPAAEWPAKLFFHLDRRQRLR